MVKKLDGNVVTRRSREEKRKDRNIGVMLTWVVD